jgi:single-strand DNA-binding protein
MALNKVFLIGNVGQDPEIRTTESGATVAQFTLATTERYKNRNGELRENTEWHNIVCWRNLADVAGNYVKKGSLLYVEGKLTSRSWEDQNGQKHWRTEVVADNFQLLGKRERQEAPLPPEPEERAPRGGVSITEAAAHVAAMQQKKAKAAKAEAQQAAEDDGSDDLPF